jgi:hypothetical protein
MRLPPFLALPTRVSRLYPVFALILLIANGLLLHSWQQVQINLDSLQSTVDIREASLKKQVEILTADRNQYQQQLTQQKAKAEEMVVQLQALEKQLAEKSDQLNAKEAQLKTTQDQVSRQEAQLSKNASELEQLRKRPPLFSFQNQSSLPDYETKQTDVRNLINSAYDYIVELYGKPYLLHSITITFVDSFSIPGSAGEIVLESGPQGLKIDIRLKDFDKNSFQDVNTVLHEIIHGFHGIAVFDTAALEEGITVAATDAVMRRMIADGKLRSFSRLYLAITEEQYSEWNRTLTVYRDADVFYRDTNVSKVYQIIGKAWYRFYEEDRTFFKRFNDLYYPQIQRGKPGDDALVLDTIRGTLTSVKGIPINTYLEGQRAFHPQ